MKPSPFLKWVGGKSKSLPALLSAMPPSPDRILEPFVGGGAFFFGAPEAPAVLGDVNAEIVNAYEVVRDQVDELVAALQEHARRFEEDRRGHYYAVRGLKADKTDCYAELDPVAAAARTIFLNKTCFNGVHRKNRKGGFNVPIGRYKSPRICNEPLLRACSAALARAELVCGGFEVVFALARPGDLVYADPPYVPVSETADFTSYSEDGFGTSDHVRLLAELRGLTERGVEFLLSSSDAFGLRERYQAEGWRVDEVSVRRNVNSKKSGRGPVTELLVRNH